ncbi:MAG: NifU family protein [Elusimicrobiota bacterium]|nr:NifU family protein [Elusimicrobiota bacterium]
MIDKEKVKKVLDDVRPALQADGGDMVLKEVTDERVVKVQLTGACAGCPMSEMTLKMGITRELKSRIKDIKSVEAV